MSFEPVLLPDAKSEAASGITNVAATLNGTISAAGGPEASCEFQLTTQAAFKKEGFAGAKPLGCSPTGPFTGSGVEAVTAEAGGLAPGTRYVFRVVGGNENGSNPGAASKAGALDFRTLGPSILVTGVKEITATAATATGLMNPNGETTTYHVEYGPTEAYDSIVPAPDATAVVPVGMGNIEFNSKVVRNVVMSQGTFAFGQEVIADGLPSGTTVTAVEGTTLKVSDFPISEKLGAALTSNTAAISQRITSLRPNTEYHFRIVAANVATATGPDVAFSTLPRETGAGTRAYEMVTPVKKIGEPFPSEPSGALGGTCAFEFCLPGLNENMMPMQATADGESLVLEGQPFSAGLSPNANQYLAKRSSTGWSSRSITSPLASSRDGYSGFKAFSDDLTRGVLFQATPALSEGVPSGEGGKAFNDLYLWEEGNPSLRPLVTVEPPNRIPGGPGLPETFKLSFSGGNSGGGETPAFTHLVFEANDALTDAVATIAPAAPEAGEAKCGGSAESNCNLYEWVNRQLALVNVLPGNEAAASGAVIGSGHRLVQPNPEYQAEDSDHAISADGSRIFWSDETGQVYVRVEGKETIELNDPGQFLTASVDGSKVLLSDGCLYSLEAESCEANLGASPEAFLGIMGASEDLSRIYFLDKEALAGAPEAGACEVPLIEPGLGDQRRNDARSYNATSADRSR